MPSAEDLLAVFAGGRNPFDTSKPGAVIAIRLDGMPAAWVEQLCARYVMHVVRIEQHAFPEGEDTVYYVRIGSLNDPT